MFLLETREGAAAERKGPAEKTEPVQGREGPASLAVTVTLFLHTGTLTEAPNVYRSVFHYQEAG